MKLVFQKMTIMTMLHKHQLTQAQGILTKKITF